MTLQTIAHSETLIESSQKFNPVRLVDRIFYWVTVAMAIAIGVILLWITWSLLSIAFPAIAKFNIGFLFSTSWNPVQDSFGALPQITGTIVSSIIALLFAVPLGVGVAVFLSENFLPSKLQTPLAFVVELLAAVPSVVYGMWGIFVLVPFILPGLQTIHNLFGWFPLFSTAPSTRQMFATALVLAIMILPTIIAISRDSLLSVSPQLRQGAYGLGATRWETLVQVIVPSALSGIIGSVMLALGRALGETMAAAMLIGNSNRISASLFAPASTISAMIANQFAEASGLQKSSLFYLALVLMVLTLVVNVLAEIIVSKFQQVE
ncbi:MAG: phosphate ABC transporter permease subunit PstC [Pegethrix bostrychoides GSE-TBD4-15B]|jgi:phosphate transport system permease protein|uniref:Phosphate transport system permease protein n=1 Tax=Pegethrix bostrychoides GSE-TBD4-15B TaxID=2839662 RepID=A0A951P6L1_9CYAN|nr:phosphate ABC transporter permease subunit PstC [Pegethrix bostrychoides GSE-TBD4-15B]